MTDPDVPQTEEPPIDEPQRDEAREISRRFKSNPTAANYLALRKQYPEVEIEVAINGGFDPLFAMQSELERHGIPIELMVAVMDSDPDAISTVSLLLLERLVEASKLRKQKQTSLIRRELAVPTMLVDWIIDCSLDALSSNDNLYIPRDLIVLIRERLGGVEKLYRQKLKAHSAKLNATLTAAHQKAMGKDCTYRDLGEIYGVAASTVQRWFAPGEFERARDEWAKHFDAQGNFSMVPLGRKIDPEAVLAKLRSRSRE